MSDIRVVPIDWKVGVSDIEPVDAAIYEAVIAYCGAELEKMPDLKQFKKAWAAIEFGPNDEILKVHGVTGYLMRPDVPLFRVTGEVAQRATKMLCDRLNAHFADMGWRGAEVLLYLNEKESPEQRCEKWDESLTSVGAVPAMRFAVKVR